MWYFLWWCQCQCQVVPWHAVLPGSFITPVNQVHLKSEKLESFQMCPSTWSFKYWVLLISDLTNIMNISKSEIRDFIRIVFVCICWYIVSSSNGVLGKTILSQFPYPVTVTMVQLASIPIWSPPLLKVNKVFEKYKINMFLSYSGSWCKKVWI